MLPRIALFIALWSLLLGAGLSSGACGESTALPDAGPDVTPAATRPLFELPGGQEQDLYALPYPNDLRLKADGTIDLASRGTSDNELTQRYLDLVAQNKLGGFGLNAAAYFRFDGPLDPTCLPQTPEASLLPASSVLWVNLQQGSAHYGEPLPLRFKFSAEESEYIGPNNLAVLPVAGFSLEPQSRYAVILRDTLCDPGGQPLGVAANFDRLLSEEAPEDPALQQAHQLYAPLRTFLSSQGISGVVAATLFTTGAPTSLASGARQVVQTLPPPAGQELRLVADGGHYWEVHGTFQAPNFQQGDPPYFPTDGGEILLDAQGLPAVARTETLRFALTVPKAPAPASGWPAVIYAHGTGGDYRTFIQNGVAGLLSSVKDEAGQEIGNLVVISIDQNLHGDRAPEGLSPDLTYFNYQNPEASIGNVIQSGADDFSLIRLLVGLRFDSLSWDPDSGKSGTQGFSPAFVVDPRRISFMGHSQGSITGQVFLAIEPGVQAAVLSGAGGNVMLSLLDKTEPLEIIAALKIFLRGEIDEFHPVLNLMQQLLEPADPLNYAPLLTSRPLPGGAPKHLFVSEGLWDHYTPPSAGDALIRGLGIPLLGPALHPVEHLELLNLAVSPLPASNNLSLGEHTITAGALQYEAQRLLRTCSETKPCDPGSYCDGGTCRSDGHFVIFDIPQARRQYSTFLATMARDGTPTIAP